MTKRYDLIGFPLGHSLSPQIHKRLFELSGIEAEYSLTEIKPEELSGKYDYLNALNGFNITIPHKIPIIKFCDELSEEAKRYESVNCVKNSAGKSVGYNTDCIGFVKSIEQLGASLESKVCLLGCGGVGRMMAIEAASRGAELTIAVRKEDIDIARSVAAEIETIAPENKTEVILLPEVKGGYDLVINATPLGMYPKTEGSALQKEQLQGVKYLFDAVYNPKETTLSKYAKEMGVKASTGMAMLVLQAVAAHEIWDGSEYDESDIEALIREMEKLV
ncbi:MAG: shikimate dehydrogenase [Ruminococcaceae bacterium]|nr:shikimate dehydrogenase [Oscillospiraceae bacterium]